MLYSKAVQEIKRLLETEQLTDNHLWYLGFEVVVLLHNHGNLTVSPQRDIEPTLCGIPIIVDYSRPCVIKLYEECKGV